MLEPSFCDGLHQEGSATLAVDGCHGQETAESGPVLRVGAMCKADVLFADALDVFTIQNGGGP